jgi:lipopolysaccharide transport system permease protein
VFKKQSVKTIIEANNKSYFSLREISTYKGLLINLAKKDFLVRYKQAFAGIAWALFRPLINILIFGYIATKIGASGSINNFLLVAAGMLLWQLFSSAFNDISNSIVSNSNLFTKVYFPKIIIPLSTLLVCLVDFVISLAIIIALFIYYQQAITWYILLSPIFVLLTIINALGIGLYFATLNVKYRDVKFIVPVLVQFGMYISSVILPTSYYLERLPKPLQYLYCLNPMVGAIDGFKFCLFGGQAIYDPQLFTISIIVSFVFLFIGLKYFYKFESSFADYI